MDPFTCEELDTKRSWELLHAIRRWELLDAIRRCIVHRRDSENGFEILDALQRHEEMQKTELMDLWELLDAIRRWELLDAIRRCIVHRRDSENGFEILDALQRCEEWYTQWKHEEMQKTELMDLKMSEATRAESSANKIWAIAEQTPYHSRKIQRGTFGLSFRSFRYFEGTGHENEGHTMQKMSDERRKVRCANKISAIAEQTDVSFPDYSSKFKKGTFALCSQFLPCAGGSYLEDSQHKQQTVNGIYQHTLRTVSHCPTSVSDYIQRAKDKCSEVCTNSLQDDGCSYHCMRDSYKTSLVEFCAKPKVLFDYCPEYDPIGERIQKDIYTLCKPSNPSQIFYRSSDSFFCDQGKCLQLRDAGVSTSVTSLMTDTTPVSGDLNESWLSQYSFVVYLFGLAVILCIVLGGIFCLRGRLVAIFRKCTKKGNPNNVQNENEQVALHNTA